MACKKILIPSKSQVACDLEKIVRSFNPQVYIHLYIYLKVVELENVLCELETVVGLLRNS